MKLDNNNTINTSYAIEYLIFYKKLLIYLNLIYIFDKILVFIFGSKSRWFQLHCLLNSIILISIIPSLINIIFYRAAISSESENNDSLKRKRSDNGDEGEEDQSKKLSKKEL